MTSDVERKEVKVGISQRKQRERREREALILDAARELLFKKGLQDTSINLIAKTAELGVGTIYSYFNSKEEIFSSLQIEGLDILYKSIESVCRREEEPEEKLRQTASRYLQFSQDQKNYFDIINYFLSSPQIMLGNDWKRKVDFQGKRILTLISGCLEKGISAGRFREADPWKCAIMFWATLHGLIQLRKLQPTILRGNNLEEFYNDSVEQMIEGFKIKGASHDKNKDDTE